MAAYCLPSTAEFLSPKSCPPPRLRNGAACFIPPSGVIYLQQFPLRPQTGLMPSFNMLFTHKNKLFTAAYMCRREENEWAPAPLSGLLYHSLTIWIANRTIYHGAVICFTCAARSRSQRPMEMGCAYNEAPARVTLFRKWIRCVGSQLGWAQVLQTPLSAPI